MNATGVYSEAALLCQDGAGRLPRFGGRGLALTPCPTPAGRGGLLCPSGRKKFILEQCFVGSSHKKTQS